MRSVFFIGEAEDGMCFAKSLEWTLGDEGGVIIDCMGHDYWGDSHSLRR
jgi:hypothetical protein